MAHRQSTISLHRIAAVFAPANPRATPAAAISRSVPPQLPHPASTSPAPGSTVRRLVPHPDSHRADQLAPSRIFRRPALLHLRDAGTFRREYGRRQSPSPPGSPVRGSYAKPGWRCGPYPRARRAALRDWRPRDPAPRNRQIGLKRRSQRLLRSVQALKIALRGPDPRWAGCRAGAPPVGGPARARPRFESCVVSPPGLPDPPARDGHVRPYRASSSPGTVAKCDPGPARGAHSGELVLAHQLRPLTTPAPAHSWGSA